MTTKLNYLILGMASLFLLSSNQAKAQDYKVTNLEELLNSPQKYSELASLSEISEVENLVYELNPTVFVTHSEVKSFGDEAPVTAVVSALNLKLLKLQNADFNAVKLLKIKIEKAADLDKSLDLSSLTGFQNLEYIVLQCAINCSVSQVQNMFSNVGDVKILYVNAIPK